MRKTLLLIIVAIATIAAACSDPSAAEQAAGSYTCTTTEITRYQHGGTWRDTTFVYKNDATVTLKQVDDKTLSIEVLSRRFGTIEGGQIAANDFNYMCNISGKGTYHKANSNSVYEVDVSGSVVYTSKVVAISAAVKDYSPRLILSFTNSPY